MTALSSNLTGSPALAAADTRQPRRRQSRYVRALCGAWLLAGIATFACAAILIGYAVGYERLYQPWPNGPSTHPFTALALFFLALGTLVRRPFRESSLSTTAYAVALAIGVLRLIEIQWGSDTLSVIGLFHDVLAQHRLSGFPITFGWNTAVAVVAAGIAGLLQTGRRPALSQISALIALAPPMVSIVGFSYGLHAFYGAMSLYTTLILITICAAMLMSTANRAIVRMILSNFTAGKMARQILLAVLIVPFAGGMLVVKLSNADNDGPVAWLVVCVALGNIAVAVRALMEVEALDKMRRKQERTTQFEVGHDPLTKLANRKLFDSAAMHEFARSRRFGATLSFVMFDVDRFKEINDKFGHQIGDQVLATVGRIFFNSRRESDVVGRYGGEEFVAFLPDTNLDGAVHWAEKLRTAIASAIFRDATDHPFSVTISAGVAVKSLIDNSFEVILNRADQAMYAAKAAGRNRTCTAP